jgi:hypothetical protein
MSYGDALLGKKLSEGAFALHRYSGRVYTKRKPGVGRIWALEQFCPFFQAR